MSIIAVLNPKGGSGKSTLATHLATALHRRDHKTILIDSDPQASARDWHGASEDNPVPIAGLDRPSAMRSLDTLLGGLDHAVIDGESKVSEMLSASVRAADIVLIPVAPSPYDIWAAGDIVELVKSRQEVADKPHAAFVITRAIANTRLSSEVTEALANYGLPVLLHTIVQRQVYPQTAAEGLTVFDSSNQAAIDEMDELVDEIVLLTEGEHCGAINETA